MNGAAQERDIDREQLRALAIVHHALAWIAGLTACLPLLPLALGVAIAAGRLAGEEPPPPPWAGWLIASCAGLLALAGWAVAFALALAGRSLKRQRRYTYCLVVACVACAFMPLGTALGIFTLVVLARESVQELFAANRPAA